MAQDARSISVESARGRTLTLSARPSSMHVDMLYGHTVSPIIEGLLYLSDQQAPVDSDLLNFLGITHIVNASNEVVPNMFPDEFKYCNVNVEDDNAEDLFPHFSRVISFLDDGAAPAVEWNSPVGVENVCEAAASLAEDAVAAALQAVAEQQDGLSEESTGASPPHSDNSTVGAAVKITLPDVSAPDCQSTAIGINTMHTQEQLEEKVVLFHCRMGISRSATLLIAYLMKSRSMTLKEAFNLVKKQRPKAHPSPIFSEALLKFEKLVHPECSSNSITFQQMCGGRMSPMRVSAIKDTGESGDDTISVTSVQSTPKSQPSNLSPINEQESSSMSVSKKDTSCGYCCVMQ